MKINWHLMLRPTKILLLLLITIQLYGVSIVSWNIQDFGQSKDDNEIKAIAQVLRSYDIIAIQEVVAKDPGGAQAVARLADQLNRMGAKWDYVISDPTHSPSAHMSERYAYLWKTSKAKMLRAPRLIEEVADIVYREPFYARFEADNKVYDILNFHSRKHDDNPEVEVYAISQMILSNTEGFNWILAGDFNMTEEDQVWEILYSKGYVSALKGQKTTLKVKCDKGIYLNHAIDNIYYNKSFNDMISSAAIDYFDNCDLVQKAKMLSDHLPVFVELISS